MRQFVLFWLFMQRKLLQNVCWLLQNHESCYFSVVFLTFLWMFLSNFAIKKIIITKLYAIGNEEKRFSSSTGIDG